MAQYQGLEQGQRIAAAGAEAKPQALTNEQVVNAWELRKTRSFLLHKKVVETLQVGARKRRHGENETPLVDLDSAISECDARSKELTYRRCPRKGLSHLDAFP